MTDGLLFRTEVACECGRTFDFVCEHPPIPMIVVGFYDDEGEGRGDDCAGCGAPLEVPAGSPHDRTHRTTRQEATAAGCRCAAVTA